MKIADKVYGKIEIEEPVLVEIINSKPLQRLKKVNQAGTQLVVTKYKEITRFNHCVGVMLLLKRFNSTLDEQIAGLIHDISHTAFSHTVDFAVGEGTSQTFHERFMKKIIFNSEIPQILKRYNVKVERVLDEHNFPLMERPIPSLCADRIDYFLKDVVMDGKGYGDPNLYLAHLTIFKNEFVFDNQEVAKKFALDFMKKCLNSWVSPITLAAFKILGDSINKAINIGHLRQEDLFADDDTVYTKLKKSKDKLIKKNLTLLTPKLNTETTNNGYDFHMIGKVRYVDPKVLRSGKTKKLSQLDASFKEIIPLFKQKVRAGHKIKIIS